MLFSLSISKQLTLRRKILFGAEEGVPTRTLGAELSAPEDALPLHILAVLLDGVAVGEEDDFCRS